MAKYLVETYYNCSFKVTHYLDEVNEKELSDLENREKENNKEESNEKQAKKLTVKELLEQRKQKNSNKRKVKD